MTNVAPLTVYTANERGNAQNCMYPNRIEITDEESAVAAEMLVFRSAAPTTARKRPRQLSG
jgi:hypothetical protein